MVASASLSTPPDYTPLRVLRDPPGGRSDDRRTRKEGQSNASGHVYTSTAEVQAGGSDDRGIFRAETGRNRRSLDRDETMPSHASEDEEPLLQSHDASTRPTTRATDAHSLQRSSWLVAADTTESRGAGDTFIMGNMRGFTAWGVQIFAFAFAALVWAMVLQRMPWNKLPLFGYHPLLQSLSLILIAQGILVLQPTTLQTPKRKSQALLWHQLFNLLAFLPLITAGAWIMWHLHSGPGAKHFISWHGTLGAVAAVWAWLQAAIGAASVWFKGKALGGEARAKGVWKWHRLSGYLLLGVFVAVYVLALMETTWTTGSVPLSHRLAAIVALGGFVVVASARIQTSKMPSLLRRS